MKRYIPTHDELIADAKFLLKGKVSHVRCDTCGYRIVWDPDEEKGKYLGCQCSVDPAWYSENLDYLNVRDIALAWHNTFRELFNDYVLERFIDEVLARKLNNKLIQKNKDKKV